MKRRDLLKIGGIAAVGLGVRWNLHKSCKEDFKKWSPRQHEIANTGYSPRPGPVDGGTERWSSSLDGEVKKIHIWGNNVYARTKNKIHVLDRSTGAKKKKIDTDGVKAIVEGILYKIKSGSIVAYRLPEMREKWRKNLDTYDGPKPNKEEAEKKYKISTEINPVYSSDMIYALTETTESWIYRGGDFSRKKSNFLRQNFYAINSRTGDLKWKKDIDNRLSYFTVSGCTIYLKRNESRLTTLNSTTGMKEREIKLSKSINSSPKNKLTDGRRIYYQTYNNFMAINSSNGGLLWNDSFLEKPGEQENISISKNTVYAKLYRDSTKRPTVIVAKNSKKGRKKWERNIKLGKSRHIITEETIYTPLSNGVIAIDNSTGETKWEHRIKKKGEPKNITVAQDLYYSVGDTVNVVTEN